MTSNDTATTADNPTILPPLRYWIATVDVRSPADLDAIAEFAGYVAERRLDERTYELLIDERDYDQHRRQSQTVLREFAGLFTDDRGRVYLAGPVPRVVESERIALTILAQVWHWWIPPVGRWVQAILADPDFDQLYDSWVAANPDPSDGSGPLISDRLEDDRGWFLRWIAAQSDLRANASNWIQDEASEFEANRRLAINVVLHRRHGRPTGDTTSPITGTGHAISSSLAAQVVEYHQSRLNLAAISAERQERTKS